MQDHPQIHPNQSINQSINQSNQSASPDVFLRFLFMFGHPFFSRFFGAPVDSARCSLTDPIGHQHVLLASRECSSLHVGMRIPTLPLLSPSGSLITRNPKAKTYNLSESKVVKLLKSMVVSPLVTPPALSPSNSWQIGRFSGRSAAEVNFQNVRSKK